MAEDNDSNDDSQKTEEPTAKKLEEARKRGQVVQSREVTSWLMLFAITLIILMMGPSIMANLRDILKIYLMQPHAMPVNGPGLQGVANDLMFEVLKQLALPLLGLAVIGIAASYAQTGPILTTETLKPDLSKISLRKGFGRLFSMKSIAEFIKGIAKMVIVSFAIYLALAPYIDGIEHFAGQEIPWALADMETLFLKMMIASLVVLFMIAIGDYLYQRHEFMKNMRMSKQEMKEEFKQTEGDPIIKSKLRQLREQKARQRMMAAVPTATVVITNPTHYAVALKYDNKDMAAPLLVAKGVDAVAQRIKEVAKESNVTIVENAPLARALYDSMEIDQVIPQEHFKAVAEVISYVFKLKGRRL